MDNIVQTIQKLELMMKHPTGEIISFKNFSNVSRDF